MTTHPSYPPGTTGNEREITGDTSGMVECGCGIHCWPDGMDCICGVDLCEDCANKVKWLRSEVEQYGLTICEQK